MHYIMQQVSIIHVQIKTAKKEHKLKLPFFSLDSSPLVGVDWDTLEKKTFYIFFPYKDCGRP